MERYGGGAIMVCDYDPVWAATFEHERTCLHGVLGARVLTIEHVGSTSVPGLAAKPIIDLLVGVRSLTEARSCCIEPIQALGYTYLPQYESWLPDELFFRKGPPGPWTHHVHMMEPGQSPLGGVYIVPRLLTLSPRDCERVRQREKGAGARVWRRHCWLPQC